MKTIIERELLSTVKSTSFAGLLLFSIFLFSLNGALFVGRINNQYRINNLLKENPYRTINETYIIKQPKLLLFIAESDEKFLPAGYEVLSNGKITQLPLPFEPHNYKLPEIPEMDWVFIVKIIFSMYVLLLGYNAISGEREWGTLRLTLSNPINRIQILVAKYCSILFIIIIPLLLGMLINLIIIGVSFPEVFSIDNMKHIATFFSVAVAYLSMFIFLCLLFSSLIRQSSVTLLSLLGIWLVFMIIPEVSGIFAQKMSKVPGEYQIAKQNYNTHNNFDYNAFYKRIGSGEFKSVEEAQKAGTQQLQEWKRLLAKIDIDYKNTVKKQLHNTRIISRFSPMSLLQYSSEIIAETGMKNQENFLSDIKSFQIIFENYTKQKTGFSEIPEYTGQYSAGFKGQTFKFGTPELQYDGDLSDFPVFQENKLSFTGMLQDALPDLSGLLIWNVILAVGAFVAFNRADVR